MYLLCVYMCIVAIKKDLSNQFVIVSIIFIILGLLLLILLVVCTFSLLFYYHINLHSVSVCVFVCPGLYLLLSLIE